VALPSSRSLTAAQAVLAQACSTSPNPARALLQSLRVRQAWRSKSGDRAAVAVAPVINWRFYDTIYTERYMRTPQENASGYDDNSPSSHADKLKGSYLLIHGTADDNVHFQNALVMSDKLVKANKQFEFMAYTDKNHGIGGGTTRLQLFTKITNYLQSNL
jgi:dipeptidyl-peptidase-4